MKLFLILLLALGTSCSKPQPATTAEAQTFTKEMQAEQLKAIMLSKEYEHTPCLDLVLPAPHFGKPYPANWADILDEDLKRIDKAACNGKFANKPLKGKGVL